LNQASTFAPAFTEYSTSVISRSKSKPYEAAVLKLSIQIKKNFGGLGIIAVLRKI
jgi:hypothetical protein